MYKHQEDGIKKLTEWEENEYFEIKGGILSFEMGMGKTRTILELIYRKKLSSIIDKSPVSEETTLVICPSSAISVWIKDIEKFYHNELTYMIMHKSYMKNKPEKLDLHTISQYDIIITTYSQVTSQFNIADTRSYFVKPKICEPEDRCLYKISEINKLREVNGPGSFKITSTSKTQDPDPTNYTPIYSHFWKRVVADESSKFSGKSTLISRAMVAINANSYFCLTGTPITNYESDLYNMFRFLGLTMPKKQWNIKTYTILALNSRVLYKTFKDTEITLPGYRYETVEIKLSDIEKKMYNHVIDKLINVMNLFKLGSKTYAAPLEMFLRLRQICVCAAIIGVENQSIINKREHLKIMKSMVTDRDTKNMIESHEDALSKSPLETLFEDKQLVEYVKNKNNYMSYSKIKQALIITLEKIRQNKKVIIFSSFVTVLNVIEDCIKQFNLSVIKLDGRVPTHKRAALQEKFNTDSNHMIFLSSYKAGGLAIDLTSASEVILMDPWWNMSVEDQAISRAYRIGQKNTVNIYSLIAIPSYETALLKIQIKKEDIKKQYFESHSQKFKKLGKSTINEIINDIVNNSDKYKI